MSVDEDIKATAVIGAAGKMGSGISLLLLQEMARLEAKNEGKMATGKYRLQLIDAFAGALPGLKTYLRNQLVRYAEKNIISLREDFAANEKLRDNEEIIRYFVQGAMDIVYAGTSLEEAAGSKLIFEAIVEDIEAKAKAYRAIEAVNRRNPFYFTNTSSIPISVLAEKGGLGSRLIGFHFYNPPAVQKLAEIIPLEHGGGSLLEIAKEIARRLEKTIVVSKDVAGFVGNGYFLREILFSCRQVEDLKSRFAEHEAVYLVNRATQDFLIRPMGTFQLLDYVGIDVGQKIGRIMNAYLGQEVYDDGLIGGMIKAGITGGQYPDGSQKDGFFQYQEHRLHALYTLSEKRYLPLGEGEWAKRLDQELGPLPGGHVPWKKLQKDPHKEDKIKIYFQNLYQENSLGASLARAVLNKSVEIAGKLVESGVAASLSDVDCVLKNGFFHLYGPSAIPAFSKSLLP